MDDVSVFEGGVVEDGPAGDFAVEGGGFDDDESLEDAEDVAIDGRVGEPVELDEGSLMSSPNPCGPESASRLVNHAQSMTSNSVARASEMTSRGRSMADRALWRGGSADAPR